MSVGVMKDYKLKLKNGRCFLRINKPKGTDKIYMWVSVL
jgi:hypothetical protein